MIPSNHAASRYGTQPTFSVLAPPLGSQRTVVTVTDIETEREFDIVCYGQPDLYAIALRYPNATVAIYGSAQLPANYRLSLPPAPEPSWEMRLAAHLEAMSSVTNALRKHRKTK